MAKNNAGNASKAYRLRRREKAGETLDPIDKLWLANYTDEQDERDAKRGDRRKALASDIGASRSKRTVHVDIDEEKEAAGTGSAATAGAIAALEAREEGRRLDYLSVGAVDALREACNVYKEICLSLRDRTEVLEATHIAMLEGVRDHFAARTEAELALQQLQASAANEDPTTGLMVQLIAQRLGVQLPGFSPNAAPPHRRGNGVKGKPPNIPG